MTMVVDESGKGAPASASTETNGVGWSEVVGASGDASFVPKTERRPVRRKRSAEERAGRGVELAGAVADLDAVKAEKKEAAADFKERIEAAERKIAACKLAVTDAVEETFREVVVRRVNASTVELLDPESGEVLDTVAEMEGETKQLTLEHARPAGGSDGDDAFEGFEDDDDGDLFVGGDVELVTCEACGCRVVASKTVLAGPDGEHVCFECKDAMAKDQPFDGGPSDAAAAKPKKARRARKPKKTGEDPTDGALEG
jgi:hypothetical protein